MKSESPQLSKTYNFSFSFRNKASRLLWNIVYFFFFKWTPSTVLVFKKWRIFLLRLFGAEVHFDCLIYSSVKIWAPWNFKMGHSSCLGPKVNCYNQGKIVIGVNTVISQNTHLCASSHDYTKTDFPLILKPITIGNSVWVAADAFIGPSVNIGDNSLVAARTVVVKNVEKNTIVGGNPAKFIRKRHTSSITSVDPNLKK